ncbi:MAG: phosphatase PAP2 family protein [Bacteroidales bacterium]
MKRFILLVSFSCLLYASCMAQTGEAKFLHCLTKNNNRFLNGYSKAFSASAEIVPYAVPVGMIAYGLIAKDKTTTMNGLQVGVSLAVSVAFTQALKYSIDRERPFDKYPGYIHNRISADSPSFPSGHTSSMAATATSLCLIYPKWYVIAPAAFWTMSVGYSRMQLGVHYPSDVAAGLLVGAGSAVLTHYANKWWTKKRKNAALNSTAFIAYQSID